MNKSSKQGLGLQAGLSPACLQLIEDAHLRNRDIGIMRHGLVGTVFGWIGAKPGQNDIVCSRFWQARKSANRNHVQCPKLIPGEFHTRRLSENFWGNKEN